MTKKRKKKKKKKQKKGKVTEQRKRTGIPILDFCLDVMEDVRRGDPDWQEGDEFDYVIATVTPKKRNKNSKVNRLPH
jgi:hypothetical protein